MNMSIFEIDIIDVDIPRNESDYQNLITTFERLFTFYIMLTDGAATSKSSAYRIKTFIPPVYRKTSGSQNRDCNITVAGINLVIGLTILLFISKNYVATHCRLVLIPPHWFDYKCFVPNGMMKERIKIEIFDRIFDTKSTNIFNTKRDPINLTARTLQFLKYFHAPILQISHTLRMV
ncbi:hypothetical protein Bhyg_02776 [Pseudolycoriella hygida]|uniref:Uncharacterized protein n=1 Tax=Pseudolycoriella hygida TaxID=35572 RepID=A0A9Q0NC27_9DIPT|nr:hypothetical protein Bhyg_02776 [Pseudolycoriella hygida]